MFTQKPKAKPEALTRKMLVDDRADSLDYIREKLTLNDLRTATQNLQAVCNIVHQILSAPAPNIVDAYKIANFVSTGFHDNLDIFQEIKRDSIEYHKGHISIPRLVNLDAAYSSEKIRGNKSEYLVKAIANMLEILDLTAHILSRANITYSNHVLLAKSILETALYTFGRDIVASTDMNDIWQNLVLPNKDAITGQSDSYVTMGETRLLKRPKDSLTEKYTECDDWNDWFEKDESDKKKYEKHKIEFNHDSILVDDTDPSGKRRLRYNGMPFCALFFIPINAWLYIEQSGFFSIKPTNDDTPYYGKLGNKDFAMSLYRELVG